MLGGYQILDLRKIDLTITKTQSNITDAYVLSQLLKLRDFIDKDYDFSKPIENQLKPVLIRYRDKKNGEKSEGAMFGELAVVDNYYTFKITGRISGALILTIKVAFQEITNAYGAKEWVINTAKIQLQDVIEDLEGNLALEGDLDVSGDLDVGGDANIFENITDANGHKRFIEGNGTPLSQEGVHITYCKWSLSGSHLMCVCAGMVENTTVLHSEDRIAAFYIPNWVAQKIFPVWNDFWISSVKILLIAEDWTNQEIEVSVGIYKPLEGDGAILCQFPTQYTLTKDRSFRFQFDLLIDNE